MASVWDGDAARLAAAFAAGFKNVDAVVRKGGDTLLAEACIRGFVEVAELLLENGADVHGGAGKLKPLEAVIQFSCQSGARRSGDELLSLAKKLLAKGAVLPENGMFNLLSSDAETAQLILKHLIDLPGTPLSGLKALFGNETTAVGILVSNRKTTDILELLLAKGAPVPTHIMAVANAMHYPLLLASGADVNALDQSGRSAVFQVSLFGDVASLETLVASGAKVHLQDQQGLTPLHVAASNGHTLVVKVLLKAGAMLDAKDNDGETPLAKAAGRSRLDVIAALIEAGASKEGAAEAADNDEVRAALGGAAALEAWRSADAKAKAVAAAAAEESASIEAAKPENKLAAAIKAAGASAVDVSQLKEVLDQGVSPNLVVSFDPTGYFGTTEMTALAACICAQMSAKNNHGWDNGGLFAIRLLLERGADPNQSFVYDGDSYTPLLFLPRISNWWGYSINGDPFLIVELLLKHGADPSVKLTDGRTALTLFSGLSSGSAEVCACVRSLVAAGAPHGPECDEMISAAERDGEMPSQRMKCAMAKALVLQDTSTLEAGLASKELDPSASVPAPPPYGSLPAPLLVIMAMSAPTVQQTALKVLKLLLDGGLDTEVRLFGQCLIHFVPGVIDGASEDVVVSFLSLLVDHKANLEAANGAGLTTLALVSQLAPSPSRTAAMRILVKAGANVETKRADGISVKEAVPALE